MNFSRFKAPLNPQETYECEGCGEEFHYTALDKHGLCRECRKDSLADYLEDVEKDRRGRE